MKKNKGMKNHFKRRFHERFNIYINDEEYKLIISMIQNQSKDVMFLFHQSRTKSFFQISYKEIKFIVVYNKERKNLHTCFPIEWLKDERYKLYE